MALGTGTPINYGQRVQTYGYGLDDIARARDRNARSTAVDSYQIGKKFQNLQRSDLGQMNRRGMLDSGVARRQREIRAGEEELERFGLAGRAQEASSQLDRQRFRLEEELATGLQQDQIANALRRFVMAQSLQGLI
tara:strand:+ start:263 stop:670 length:408 start_codon:yes stop_codon:yes gene_type:complete